jgi:hypothetical protein
VSGDPDAEESSRRRLLALLGAAVLTLVGAGAGVSNFLGGGDDESEADGIDLSVDYSVTPDEPTATPAPTPTPTPGGGTSSADGTADLSEGSDTTRTDEGTESESTPTEVPRRYDDPDDDPRSRTTAGGATTSATTPGDELVTTAIPPVSVADVEPGDGGTIDLSVTLSGGPARLWVRGDVTATEESGTSEVERSAGDDGEPGELQDYVQVQVWYDADGDGTVDDSEDVVFEGTLAELEARDGWLALTEACVTPGAHTARVRWDLPSDAPNVVQTDSVSFALGIAADTSECA